MELTMGKRIAGYRKKLGMTQDQLAERLGVTAQAVSKWENDQSCPDITMLPKLAEIFNTSTDVLLGVAAEEPVHEATVVEAPQEETPQDSGGTWEFQYDNSRKAGIGFAILVLLVGGLYLTVSLLKLDITLWDIIWPSALLVFGISGLIPGKRFSFLRLGCLIFGGFFLVNNFVPVQVQLDSGVFIACIILLIGGGLLMDALRKPRKPVVKFSYNGSDHGPQHDLSIDGETFLYSGSFGDQDQYVAMSRLCKGAINTSFGDYDIDLSGVQEVAKDCRIEANASFGDLTIRVPRKYLVRCTSSAAFASVEVEGQPDPEPAGIIHLEANASFGQITVEYI